MTTIKNKNMELTHDANKGILTINDTFHTVKSKDEIKILTVLLSDNPITRSKVKVGVDKKIFRVSFFKLKMSLTMNIFLVLKELDLLKLENKSPTSFILNVGDKKFNMVYEDNLFKLKSHHRHKKTLNTVKFKEIKTDRVKLPDIIGSIQINGYELKNEEIAKIQIYLVNEIKKAIVEQGSFSISGFGSFTYKQAYVKKNQYMPETGCKNDILIKANVRFKASKALRDKLLEKTEGE